MCDIIAVMEAKRVVAVVIIFLVLAFLWAQIYVINKELNQQKRLVGGENEKLELLKLESSKIEKDIEYYSIAENIRKALREKFNLKKADEKMIVVVPE